MADEFPSMPLYWRDWLSGQSTTLMTAEQEGAFLNLLLRAWGASPPCTLPDDDRKLAQLSKMGSRWKKNGALVRERFKSIGGGLLRNEKQWSIYQELLNHRQRRQLAGRKGNAKRWGEGRNAIANPSQSDRNALAKSSPSSASASARTDRTDDGELKLTEAGPRGVRTHEEGGRSSMPAPNGTHAEPPSRKVVLATLAPLIREHLWLGSKPPPHGTEPPWTLDRDLRIAEQLLADHDLELDEMADVIRCARPVLQFGPNEKLTMRIFTVKGRGDRLEDVLRYVRNRNERQAAEEGLRRIDSLIGRGR